MRATHRIAFALSIAACVGLTGCGGEESSNQNQTTLGTTSTSTAGRGSVNFVDGKLWMYRTKNGSYPASLGELGLSDDELTNQWGHRFVYQRYDDGEAYTLLCPGPDGTPGNEDDSLPDFISGIAPEDVRPYQP